MNKPLRTIFAVFLLLSAFLPHAFADGCSIAIDEYRPDDSSGGAQQWQLLPEKRQDAFIAYHDGQEELILSIDTEKDAKQALWIFPVPAKPEAVQLDIIKNPPNFMGDDIFKQFISTIDKIRECLWFGIFEGVHWPSMYGAASSLGARVDVDGIAVHASIDKYGVASELISATNGIAIYEYLKAKGYEINKGALPVLDEYIGKDYSFVISGIGTPDMSTVDVSADMLRQYLREKESKGIAAYHNLLQEEQTRWNDLRHSGVWFNEYKTQEDTKLLSEAVLVPGLMDSARQYVYSKSSHMKSVFIKFPSKELSFPLRLTSVYEKTVVPAEVRVMGLVTPHIYDALRPYVHTEYFTNAHFDGFPEKFIYDRANSNYTLVTLSAPGTVLKDDLWFDSTVPRRIAFEVSVLNHAFIVQYVFFGFILFAAAFVALYFSGLSTGRVRLLHSFGITLASIFTVAGGIIYLILLCTKTEDTKIDDAEISTEGNNSYRQSLGFILAYCNPLIIMPWVIFSFVIKWFSVNMGVSAALVLTAVVAGTLLKGYLNKSRICILLCKQFLVVVFMFVCMLFFMPVFRGAGININIDTVFMFILIAVIALGHLIFRQSLFSNYTAHDFFVGTIKGICLLSSLVLAGVLLSLHSTNKYFPIVIIILLCSGILTILAPYRLLYKKGGDIKTQTSVKCMDILSPIEGIMIFVGIIVAASVILSCVGG
jgi:hypothetical protein